MLQRLIENILQVIFRIQTVYNGIQVQGQDCSEIIYSIYANIFFTICINNSYDQKKIKEIIIIIQDRDRLFINQFVSFFVCQVIQCKETNIQLIKKRFYLESP
ncbi:hypothetical protein TTHERM_000439147 (macronuclear) [Tetrahymena thermophila SB210]|uniref:Uncharacterized protein n=1 Tax=Tetrahymena thermophila (strain SB210) TaxID=312017 RepID=W7X3R9_TETTS|nr:hypothetical protein TTHERM_000439147 [Tetrahymena thermophila SB210]EWS73960.1 hypothetical protein TTHERM_000439147 [Tetrahymena thermophila SB210]|eukprot:XP_012653501.1 hypothetical protein TTHERM_000439147 [Tetrahymena thermophila SB210]